MSSLTIFYLCLLIPSALYFLISLFSGVDSDIDANTVAVDTADTISHGDFKFSISSLCYFLIGFSAAGLLFEQFGTFISVVAGLVTGTICFFILKSIFIWIVRFCFSGEVGIPQPEIGDECITLNNISSDNVGLVRIFKKVGIDNHLDKTLTYFAISDNNDNIKPDTACIVSRIEGNRVVVEPTPNNE